jgi:hypothetical protein
MSTLPTGQTDLGFHPEDTTPHRLGRLHHSSVTTSALLPAATTLLPPPAHTWSNQSRRATAVPRTAEPQAVLKPRSGPNGLRSRPSRQPPGYLRCTTAAGCRSKPPPPGTAPEPRSSAAKPPSPPPPHCSTARPPARRALPLRPPAPLRKATPDAARRPPPRQASSTPAYLHRRRRGHGPARPSARRVKESPPSPASPELCLAAAGRVKSGEWEEDEEGAGTVRFHDNNIYF